MRVLQVAAAAALLCCCPDPGRAQELLEPDVKRIPHVLPEAACKELIALGEAEGFLVDEESIDEDESNYGKGSAPSQSIEVFERHGEHMICL